MYMPLLLAKNQGYFPDYFTLLEPSGSDEESINELCHIADSKKEAHVAVCDPHFTQWERIDEKDL